VIAFGTDRTTVAQAVPLIEMAVFSKRLNNEAPLPLARRPIMLILHLHDKLVEMSSGSALKAGALGLIPVAHTPPNVTPVTAILALGNA